MAGQRVIIPRGLGTLLPARRVGSGALLRTSSNTAIMSSGFEAHAPAGPCGNRPPTPAAPATASGSPSADETTQAAHATASGDTQQQAHSTQSTAKPLLSGTAGAGPLVVDAPGRGSRPGKRKAHAPRPGATKQRRKAGSAAKCDEGRDLVGAVVQVPASVFFVDVPGLYYSADVLRPDRQHPNSMQLRFRDDRSLYWFPIPDVRTWLADMDRRGAAVSDAEEAAGMPSSVTEREADDFAASVLTELAKPTVSNAQPKRARHAGGRRGAG